MVTLENIPDEVEKVLRGTKYPHLRVLSGGGNPPIGGGINWLNGLEKGTAFTCKQKGKTEELEFFIIAFKYDRSIILVGAMDQSIRRVVDPEEFCKKYNYWETIAKEEAGEQPEGVDDGSREGTIQPSSVEDDAGPQVG